MKVSSSTTLVSHAWKWKEVGKGHRKKWIREREGRGRGGENVRGEMREINMPISKKELKRKGWRIGLLDREWRLSKNKGKKNTIKKTSSTRKKDKRKAKKKNIYTIKNSQSKPIYKNLTKHCVFLFFYFLVGKGSRISKMK